MPSPVRSERVKNEKHVERKQRSLMKSTYLTRPYDFLLGTKTGQFVLIMAMWIFLVFLGALFFYWAGGSRAMDLGLPNDDFWDSLWASYVLFIDIGTVEIFFFLIYTALFKTHSNLGRYSDRDAHLRLHECSSRGCYNLTRWIYISTRHTRSRCRYCTSLFKAARAQRPHLITSTLIHRFVTSYNISKHFMNVSLKMIIPSS